MKKLNSLIAILIVLFTVSCTMSAKNETEAKNSPETTDKTTTVAAGAVVNLDRQGFLTKVFNYEENMNEWKYEGSKPCIIDFYADWCPPCKKIAPILTELAGEYSNDIIVYKVNVDDEKELAATFGIQSIPTLLFVPMNGEPRVSMGALSKDQFEQEIKGFLLK